MKRRTLALLAGLILLAGTLSGCGSRRFTVEQAQRGVVRVAQMVRMDIYAVEDGQITAQIASREGILGGTGTAFGVGKAGQPTDTFVTNRHVVSDHVGILEVDAEGNPSVVYQNTVTAMYILLDDYSYNSSTGLDTSRAVPCTIVYAAEEPGPDLAVLKAAEPVKDRIALSLLDPAGNVRPGDTIYALGFPGSSDDITFDPEKQVDKLLAGIESMTVTKGSVTLLSRDVESGTDIMQHDAQTNSGNSGSPLITEDGAVVAVHYASHLSTGNRTETVSKYSVQAGELMAILDGLKISYDVFSPGPGLALIAGGAVALAVAAAAAIVALARRKKAAPGPAAPAAVPAPGGAELRIQGQSGAFAGRRFAIGGQVRIGRDPGGNDLVYPDGTPGISGRHCVVALSGGQVTLTDLGSSYGTFLAGGQKLAPNQPVTLRVGDRFYLGSEKEGFVITGKGGSLT